jgi:hypothetical protein
VVKPNRGGLEHSGLAAFGSAVAALLTSRGMTPGLAIAPAAYVFLLTTPVFVAMHRQFMLMVRPCRRAAEMCVLTGAEFLAGWRSRRMLAGLRRPAAMLCCSVCLRYPRWRACSSRGGV